MDDESAGLRGMPAGLLAAWGRAARPAKGPRPTLTIEAIVTAAVGIAGSEGLAAVSMSKVAAEVGVTAMALYRYVTGKDELLALMVDFSLGPPPEVGGAGQYWRTGLSEWAQAQGAAYRRHPWALRVPVQGVPMLPHQVGWLERGLRCLAVGSLTEEQKLSSVLLVSNVVRAYCAVDLDLATGWAASGTDPDAAMARYARTMDQLIDPARFPALRAALASGTLDRADPLEKELRFGLDRVLDGIEVLIERGKGGPGGSGG